MDTTKEIKEPIQAYVFYNLIENQELNENQIGKILDMTKEIKEPSLSYIIQSLAKKRGLNKKQINRVLNMIKKINRKYWSYALQSLAEKQELNEEQIDKILTMTNGMKDWRFGDRCKICPMNKLIKSYIQQILNLLWYFNQSLFWDI